MKLMCIANSSGELLFIYLVYIILSMSDAGDKHVQAQGTMLDKPLPIIVDMWFC